MPANAKHYPHVFYEGIPHAETLWEPQIIIHVRFAKENLLGRPCGRRQFLSTFSFIKENHSEMLCWSLQAVHLRFMKKSAWKSWELAIIIHVHFMKQYHLQRVHFIAHRRRRALAAGHGRLRKNLEEALDSCGPQWRCSETATKWRAWERNDLGARTCDPCTATVWPCTQGQSAREAPGRAPDRPSSCDNSARKWFGGPSTTIGFKVWSLDPTSVKLIKAIRNAVYPDRKLKDLGFRV